MVVAAAPVSAQEAPPAPAVSPGAGTPAATPAASGPAAETTAPAIASPPGTGDPALPPVPAAGPSAPSGPAGPSTVGAAPTAPDDPAPAEGGEALVDAATLPHDLSPWGMFLAADSIVKAVMIGLAFASVVTWTIGFAKAMELAAAKGRARRAVRRLERSESLAQAMSTEKGSVRWPKRGPVAALAQAAAIEVDRSGGLGAEGVKERAAVALQRIEARAGRAMSRGTGLLATIGSTAPFVGLFGTVWGIMNAFIGISQANTTNLAVVAPGIAEALLATAIGLVAAIPAVIVYNVFARAIAGYRAVLADASAEVMRHLSRDLDRGTQRAPPAPQAALQAAE